MVSFDDTELVLPNHLPDESVHWQAASETRITAETKQRNTTYLYLLHESFRQY